MVFAVMNMWKKAPGQDGARENRRRHDHMSTPHPMTSVIKKHSDRCLSPQRAGDQCRPRPGSCRADGWAEQIARAAQ